MPDFHSTSRHCSPRWVLILLLIAGFSGTSLLADVEKGEPPAWKVRLEKDQKSWREDVTRLDQAIKSSPDRVGLYSQRGDAHFFLGHFKQAVADYDRMIEIDPEQSPGHWRRGIALYYTGKFKEAAAQFDRYHSFDNVDRENGIWRYLSHYRAYGKERARKELLKYEKDDREPFPSVYKLFAGEIEPDSILAQLDEIKLTAEARESRQFYSHLYIGLNFSVEGHPGKARQHLEKMLPNTWGPDAGYGPHFMWQVGRLQWELMASPNKEETDGMGIKSSKSIKE